MIRIFYKESEDQDFTLLDEPCAGCWIHIDEVRADDLEELSQLTGLEYNDLRDCLDKYEQPRVETVNHHTLIFIRSPSEQEPGLYTTTFAIIMTKRHFITVCPQKSYLVKSVTSQPCAFSTAEHSQILLSLLAKANHEFSLQIKRVRTNVLKQEKEMINVDSDDITSLTRYEEVLNQYASSLTPFLEVLETLTTGRHTTFYQEDHDLIEDLHNAIQQSVTICTNQLRSIRSLRDSYQIIFTNNLHKTIKLLTSLTILFSIPTMVASLYGMNVDLPLATRSYSFVFILLFIFALSFAALLLFRRKQWL
jgi:magnesium transporter